MKLTPRQARLHLEAIGRAEHRRKADQLWLMRVARASDENFNAVLKELTDTNP